MNRIYFSAFCRPSVSRLASQVFIPLGFGCGVGMGGRISTPPLVLRTFLGVGRCTGYQRSRSRSLLDLHLIYILILVLLVKGNQSFSILRHFFVTWLTFDLADIIACQFQTNTGSGRRPHIFQNPRYCFKIPDQPIPASGL